MKSKFSKLLRSGSLLLVAAGIVVAVVAGVAAHGRVPQDGPNGYGSIGFEPVNLGPSINTASSEFQITLTADGLTMYFVSDRAGTLGGNDVWVAKRQDPNAPWGPAVNLGPNINSPANEAGPFLTPDGHCLYFTSRRPGGLSGSDLWKSCRDSLDEEFGANPSVNLGPPLNSAFDDDGGAFYVDPSTGLLVIIFPTTRPPNQGDLDYWTATQNPDGTWSDPVPVNELNTPFRENGHPSISPDGLTIYFSSRRPGRLGNLGKGSIWVSTHATTSDPWSTPVELPDPINTLSNNASPFLVHNSNLLYFASDRVGGFASFDFYVVQVPRPQ
jgi:WD40 repeat protein